MRLFQEFSGQPSGRAVLLSIKPKYAELILAGTKRVELRRSWPSNDIGVLVLYSSAPVQQLVGVAYVDRLEETNVEGLWQLASNYGGGVTREELDDYFVGKQTAFGIMIERAERAPVTISPKELFPDFIPPQSYQYLTAEDFYRVMKVLFPGEQKS